MKQGHMKDLSGDQMNSGRQGRSFRFLDSVHTKTHTHINTEGILSEHSFFERQSVPKRVRDEKEVREAKALSP